MNTYVLIEFRNLTHKKHTHMERRRLQQQKMKQQQQRFCVSQQDLTQAIARMKPQRRATHDNLPNICSSSIETLTIPSVSQLIKDFEARAVSTPYVSAQDFIPIDNDVVSNGAESNCFQQTSVRTMKIKVNHNNDNNNISSSISRLNSDNDQTLIEKTHLDQFTGDEEQETVRKGERHQTLDNDRYKRDLPSSSSSSFYNIESNNNTNSTTPMLRRNTDPDSTVSSRRDKRFSQILSKEAQLDHAVADLISLSNDADISSSISSSSRSLTNRSQRRRASSTNENTNNISASIALLNNLLDTFDLDHEDYKTKTYKKNNTDQSSEKNVTIKSTSSFW